MKLAFAILALGIGAVAVPSLWPSGPTKSEGFNPDKESSRIEWTAMREALGPVPMVAGRRFGMVVKTQVNEYWQLMTEGYRRRSASSGLKVDIQAASSEDDPSRQLSIMYNMVGNRYAALLISPISDVNLRPAIDDAIAAGVTVVDVDGAVVDNVRNFVGPVNYRMGESVAAWFIAQFPEGGEIAVIEGQEGVFSTVQRTAGFKHRLLETGRFKIAASERGDWDRRKAFDATIDILKNHPDVIGIYCNNDTMAMSAVEAAKSLGLLHKVRIFGNDGTRAAYASIEAGELTGTIDIFPALIGAIGVEVGERIVGGQEVPRVVETPQALVTASSIVENRERSAAMMRMLSDEPTNAASRTPSG